MLQVDVAKFYAAKADRRYTFRDDTRSYEPEGTKSGIELELFPPSLSSAPFEYKDLRKHKKHYMAFMGGITSLVQHPDGSIDPKTGWAVMDSGKGEPIGHSAEDDTCTRKFFSLIN